jgi:hypothetical protein
MLCLLAVFPNQRKVSVNLLVNITYSFAYRLYDVLHKPIKECDVCSFLMQCLSEGLQVYSNYLMKLCLVMSTCVVFQSQRKVIVRAH